MKLYDLPESLFKNHLQQLASLALSEAKLRGASVNRAELRVYTDLPDTDYLSAYAQKKTRYALLIYKRSIWRVELVIAATGEAIRHEFNFPGAPRKNNVKKKKGKNPVIAARVKARKERQKAWALKRLRTPEERKQALADAQTRYKNRQNAAAKLADRVEKLRLSLLPPPPSPHAIVKKYLNRTLEERNADYIDRLIGAMPAVKNKKL